MSYATINTNKCKFCDKSLAGLDPRRTTCSTECRLKAWKRDNLIIVVREKGPNDERGKTVNRRVTLEEYKEYERVHTRDILVECAKPTMGGNSISK